MRMECGILQFLHNKTIFITGATGFIAKLLIEKILRVEPNVKKLYLLLRAADLTSASHRFNTEVLNKDLFRVVKEKYGENGLNSIVEERIRVLGGDIAHHDGLLGLQGNNTLLEELFREVEVVVNLAATTNFDERYDVALGINTIGATNVLSFAKKCKKLKVLLHVSTAYVCGEKEGVILEDPFKLGDTLNGTYGLNINKEKELVEETMELLVADNASHNQIVNVMKDLGYQRATKFGWPNTYSFTKAMGEMLLGHLKEDIPLVIIRPTIVTSTYKEPFPGWLEGVRNIDSFVVGYGKGKMTWFPGDPQSIIDLIPADMVVNSIIVAMSVHANKPADTIIFHVGSSMLNPISYQSLQLFGLHFFTERPWFDKGGNPVVVRKGKQLATICAVRQHLKMHYMIPLKILGVINTVCCQYFQATYLNLSRKVKFLVRLIELFSPYVFFKGIFDDTNSEKLRRATMRESEMFYFDPKAIDWDDYFMNTHIAAVVKYAFK